MKTVTLLILLCSLAESAIAETAECQSVPKDDGRHFSRLDAQRGWLSITLQSVRTDMRQSCNLLWMLSA
jgi:hypothetical protein